MNEVYVLGVHMFRFGRFPERSIKDMVAEVVRGAVADAGIRQEQLEAAWFANSGWGNNGGQACIRGQVALRPLGIGDIPVMNVENACAGGSSAFHGACLGVRAGAHDVALAVGAEKVFQEDALLMFASFLTGLDVGNLAETLALQAQVERDLGISTKFPPEYAEASTKRNGGASAASAKKPTRRGGPLAAGGKAWRLFQDVIVLGNLFGWETLQTARRAGASVRAGGHSPFMDVYSVAARQHMKRYGSTIEQLACIAAKNHHHSTLNPLAQYQFDMTPAEVLADRQLSFPLTRAMCAPIGDGAAAAIVCSKAFLQKVSGARPVRVRASVLGSGRDRAFDGEDIGARVGRRAYEQASVGPADIDLAELHDATAFGELHHSETLGFCKEGEGGVFAMSGATALGGKLPIGVSGGLESRGHPIAASGLAQLHELVTQLRGEAGARQVEGARLGLAQNGGGALGVEEAAMAIHILEAAR